jgi:hypothetical protein
MLLPIWTIVALLYIPSTPVAAASTWPVIVERTPQEAAPAPCIAGFVATDLDHLTTTADGAIRMFQANGAGLAAGDLDGDGDLDLVLGAMTGADTLLWNEGRAPTGGILWRTQRFGTGQTRMVTLVDVDGDGRLDLVLTRSTGTLTYYRNGGIDQTGQIQWMQTLLPGVSAPASVLGWADLDGDGDLDLVTATYDAGLLTDLGNSYLLANRGGIVVYTQAAGRFRPQRLATTAQAMAISLLDLDGDGRRDLWVGNDFAEPDRFWRQTAAGGWEAFQPFAVTTHSTMSLDAGDLNNDGTLEFFATDMHPYADDAATRAAWAPIMLDMMNETLPPSDLQIMANTLQHAVAPGVYVDLAPTLGVAATGWSWSAKFGDLDNNGYLDLYGVNGMREVTLFAHLPNHELVEQNQAFANMGDGRLIPQPRWGLDDEAGGRGMIMADFDADGDLDIVVNNLGAPARFFENRLCGGRSIQVELDWQGVQNVRAIGAELRMQTNLGTLTRQVSAASGYLSGDPARVHFGLPPGAVVGRLEILWPDGARSSVTDLLPGQLLHVTRRAP